MPYLVGYPTPQDFGAVGNGVADDTSAIQAAINSINGPSGGTLYFPPGLYLVSAPLVINSPGVRLLGNHSGNSGFEGGGNYQTAITAASGFVGATIINSNGQLDFSMRDLTIHGHNMTSGTTVGITITGDALLEDVLVGYMVGDGIRVGTGSGSNVWLRNVGVFRAGNSTGVGYGFVINQADAAYIGCLSSGHASGGWNILHANNSTFTACRSEDGKGTGSYGFYFNSDSSVMGGISFNQCTTDLNNGDGFRIDTLTGNGCIQLNGCEFRRDGNNNGTGSTTYSGIVVNNCTVPVVIDGTTVTARQGDSGGADGPHFGIRMTTSSFVTVSGGYFSTDATGTALSWDSAGTFRVGMNVLTATVTSSVATVATNVGQQNTTTQAVFNSLGVRATSGATTIVGGTTTVGGGSNGNGIFAATATDTQNRAYTAQVSGDTSARYAVFADGATQWGSGSASRDTFLARPSGGGLTLTMPSTLVETLGGNIQSTTTTTTIANTNALSTLQTFTIPANDPAAGSVYMVNGYGVFSVTGTPTLTFALYWGGTGGTLIASIPAITAASGITSAPFMYSAMVNFRSTTSCTARIHLNVVTATASDISSGYVGTPTTATTVTTTGANALAVGFTWSAASASNTISLLGGNVQRVA